MSIKKTLKRIALVAVSAMGFGLMTSISPASAVDATPTALTVGTIPTAQVGVAVATPITVSVPLPTLAGSDSFTVNVRVTSAPTGSAFLDLPTRGLEADGTAGVNFGLGVYASGSQQEAKIAIAKSATDTGIMDGCVAIGTGSVGWGCAYTSAARTTAGTSVGVVVSVTPDKAGSYSVLVSTVKGGTPTAYSATTNDANVTYTFTTASSVASVALASVTPASLAGNSNGQIFKATIKDSSGAVAQLAPNETITFSKTSGAGTVTMVGLSATDGTSVGTSGATFTATSANFTNGVGYFRFTNSEAETAVITATGSGLLSSTVTGTLSLTTRTNTTVATGAVFTDSTAQAAAITLGTGGHSAVSGTYASSASRSATSHAYTVTYGTPAAAAGDYVTATVVDTSGKITGVVGGTYAYALTTTAASSAVTTGGKASVSITATLATSGNSFTVTTGGSTLTVSSAAAAVTDIVKSYPTRDTYNVAAGAAHSFTMKIVDQFGAAVASSVVTVSRTGRNATTSATTTTLVSDSAGMITYTYTDAGTATTTNKQDVVTVTSSSVSSVTETFTINYGTFTPASITCLTGNEDDTATSVTYRDIDSNDGAEAGAGSLCTVTIKDANGAILAGVPVTVTTASEGAAVVSTSATLYTSASGTVAPSVYAWTTGQKKFTITSGAITKDVTVNYHQETAAEVRSISATLSGNIVKVTAKDRFGNVVPGVRIYGTRVGTGTFGSGTANANAITGSSVVDDANEGIAEFIVTGGSDASTFKFQVASAADTPDATYGYTDAVKGSSDDGTTALTAYVAGTTTKAEVGVGASFDAAGVNSLTLSVAAAVNSATVAAEAATDAAAEAIDAANAATDAANLAAEAADAATVAAEEARDAADAATAAVEELATQVATLMAALKAQITTLANTVAKIAKKVKA